VQKSWIADEACGKSCSMDAFTNWARDKVGGGGVRGSTLQRLGCKRAMRRHVQPGRAKGALRLCACMTAEVGMHGRYWYLQHHSGFNSLCDTMSTRAMTTDVCAVSSTGICKKTGPAESKCWYAGGPNTGLLAYLRQLCNAWGFVRPCVVCQVDA
jgi:hypothetical protein